MQSDCLRDFWNKTRRVIWPVKVGVIESDCCHYVVTFG